MPPPVVRISRFRFQPRCAWPARQKAFTLIELVTVMILIGILAVVAMPRFADKGAFAAAGFADELRSALKHSRRSAVAMRRNVCVTLTSNTTLTFMRNRGVAAEDDFTCAAEAATLPLPGSQNEVLTAPTGVSVTFGGASPLVFNGLGQPLSGMTISVNGSDGTKSSVKVEGYTGYVR